MLYAAVNMRRFHFKKAASLLIPIAILYSAIAYYRVCCNAHELNHVDMISGNRLGSNSDEKKKPAADGCGMAAHQREETAAHDNKIF